MSKGKPNGFGRDTRVESDTDLSFTWQIGFFKDSYNLEGKGSTTHYWNTGEKVNNEHIRAQQGLFSLDQPSTLWNGPVLEMDFKNDFRENQLINKD